MDTNYELIALVTVVIVIFFVVLGLAL